MELRIKDFEDYAITDKGEVISYKYKKPKKLKTFISGSGYEQIKLCKNNKTYHKQIHRLVAEAFLKNEFNLPEVNHKDHNQLNNNLENLEWISRSGNMEHSRMGFKRHFHKCKIINLENNKEIKEFESKWEACKWAEENLNCSFSSLRKHLVYKNYKIILI